MSHYYTQDNHGPYELIDIGPLDLEEGGVLERCTLAVTTFGQLNSAKDNAILVTTWYSGTSKIMEQVYIGPDRALDPAKYFVIVVNQIGSGLSVSPHIATGLHAGAGFPRVRIGDDVRAQHRLLTQKFGIRRLALVVGGSMGAQQTYEWAVRFPDMVERAAPIAGTACATEHNALIAETLAEAITTDPGFQDGAYASLAEVASGLKRHAKLWTLLGWSAEFFQRGRHRDMGFDSLQRFVDEFMAGYFGPMDPNNLLCMAWKWQRCDVSRHTGGDKSRALGGIRARTFVMPISTDMLFPVEECHAEQQLIPSSELRPIHTIDGHFALLGTDANAIAQIDSNLRDLLGSPSPSLN